MSVTWRGLDLMHPDDTTPVELEAYSEHEGQSKEFIAPSDKLWFNFRPGAAKRKFLTVNQADIDETRPYQMPNTLGALHYYAIIGYEDGIMYQLRLARHRGATLEQVLDTLAVAYTHAHARGMNTVAKLAYDYLVEWRDSSGGAANESAATAFPPGWSYNRDAFKSGLDFTDPELSKAETALLDDWYLRNLGEIPPYVHFLSTFRPALLKANRNRFENAIQGGLPSQMMAYCMLYFNTIRGFSDGIREAVLLARWLGMSKEQTVTAICRGMTSYGGPDSLSIAYTAAGDLLERM